MGALDLTTSALILATAVLSGFLSGLSGFGAGLMLSAFLVPVAGAKSTVALLAVAMVITNLGRISAFSAWPDLRRAALVLAGSVPAMIPCAWLLARIAAASDEDDGYLSCPPATPQREVPKTRKLSPDLARAFIYAQARTLLVSHWEVDSNAAVKVVTSAMRAIANDKSLGRSEALRHAMLALIDKGQPSESHPAFWAPFIIVGDGTR